MNDTLNTRHGAILFDPSRLAKPDERWFEPGYWVDSGAVSGSATGRGTTLIVTHRQSSWVLRHYRRGGLVARWVEDRFVWLGACRTRSFREWRLLQTLFGRGLPVPRPVAARYVRSGALYTADILTDDLGDVSQLAAIQRARALPHRTWSAIGRCIRRFHDAGLFHADLTSDNLLLNAEGKVFLVDFDRCGLRSHHDTWKAANLARLKRSILKRQRAASLNFSQQDWAALIEGYESSA